MNTFLPIFMLLTQAPFKGAAMLLAQVVAQQLVEDAVVFLGAELGVVELEQQLGAALSFRPFLRGSLAQIHPQFLAFHPLATSCTQRSNAGSAWATLLPWMASPLVTTAPLAAPRMSRSVWDRPLPSWVQKGWMVFPVKS